MQHSQGLSLRYNDDHKQDNVFEYQKEVRKSMELINAIILLPSNGIAANRRHNYMLSQSL